MPGGDVQRGGPSTVRIGELYLVPASWVLPLLRLQPLVYHPKLLCPRLDLGGEAHEIGVELTLYCSVLSANTSTRSLNKLYT